MSTIISPAASSVSPFLDLAGYAYTVSQAGGTPMQEIASNVNPAIVFDVVRSGVTLTGFDISTYHSSNRTIKWSLWLIDGGSRVTSATYTHTTPSPNKVVRTQVRGQSQALTCGARYALGYWANNDSVYSILASATTSLRFPTPVNDVAMMLANGCQLVGSWWNGASGGVDLIPTSGNTIHTTPAAVTIYTTIS